jgi:LuxR family transcriptional regulator, maltose regulon positive regulatory protein
MTHKLATVSQGILYGEQTQWRSIPLDSPQWFAWLETPAHVGFSYALYNASQGYIDGFITLRKERRQRGGAYWTAYRRQGRRLRKLYLGPSAALTHARLEEVASHLRVRDSPCI